jgi:sigma-E factor negative regulatory protein RseC
MMITWVEVVQSDEMMTTVRPLNASDCGGCHAQSVGCCASRAEEGDLIHPASYRSLRLPLPLSLQAGQQLELGIQSSEIVRLALLLYLSPVGGLLLAAVLLEQLGVSEGWVVSGAFMAAGSSWLGVRAILTAWIPSVTCRAVTRFSYYRVSLVSR